MDKTEQEVEDIALFVKRALSNEPVRGIVRNKLIEISKANPKDMIDLLVQMKSEFFNEGKALLEPEELELDFMDFLTDDGMWETVEDIAKNGIGSGDSFVVNIIRDSVKDLVDRDVIFSNDIKYEEAVD